MATEAIHGQTQALSEFETSLAMAEGIWREAYWGDMRVGYETYLAEYDDVALLAGFPNDRCQCPHWGNLLSGRTTVRYADHEEVVEAGDVYYVAPDHGIAVDAGTVLIEFSPLAEWEELMAIAEANLAALGEAGGADAE